LFSDKNPLACVASQALLSGASQILQNWWNGQSWERCVGRTLQSY